MSIKNDPRKQRHRYAHCQNQTHASPPTKQGNPGQWNMCRRIRRQTLPKQSDTKTQAKGRKSQKPQLQHQSTTVIEGGKKTDPLRTLRYSQTVRTQLSRCLLIAGSSREALSTTAEASKVVRQKGELQQIYPQTSSSLPNKARFPPQRYRGEKSSAKFNGATLRDLRVPASRVSAWCEHPNES